MIGKGSDCLHPIYIKLNDEKEGLPYHLRVPCGHCLNCKARRRREWSMRLAMESQYWDKICFVTLTYDDLHVKKAYVGAGVIDDTDNSYEVNSLCRRDAQLFMKRLRKRLDHKIKFYCTGEYGPKTRRPHMHLIIYGLDTSFTDIIKDAWQNGFVVVKDFFPTHCVYIAGYIQKKLYGKNSFDLVEPEFLNCSHGLGDKYFLEHIDEFDDEHPYIVFQGFKYGLPRRYVEILVERGKLKKMEVHEFHEKQLKDYQQLLDWCQKNGIDPLLFFDNRKKLAKIKEQRYMASRIKNEEKF